MKVVKREFLEENDGRVLTGPLPREGKEGRALEGKIDASNTWGNTNRITGEEKV